MEGSDDDGMIGMAGLRNWLMMGPPLLLRLRRRWLGRHLKTLFLSTMLLLLLLMLGKTHKEKEIVISN